MNAVRCGLPAVSTRVSAGSVSCALAWPLHAPQVEYTRLARHARMPQRAIRANERRHQPRLRRAETSRTAVAAAVAAAVAVAGAEPGHEVELGIAQQALPTVSVRVRVR